MAQPESNLTPHEVFERIQRAATTGEPDLGDLYADDAVHEWPFPIPGAPRRLSGIEQIRAWREQATGGRRRFVFDRYENVVVHDTTDPEVLIAEYDIHGHVTATNRPFVFSYILVLRVRDGRIVLLRDYLDPLAMSRMIRGSAESVAAEQVLAPPSGHADLLTHPVFAHVATIGPNGGPHSGVMWFEWDGTQILLTHSRRGRKYRNLAADPHVAVSLADPDNPYRSLEIRGIATVQPDFEARLFTRLANRYGQPDMPTPDPTDRIVISIRPTSYATSGPAAA